MRKIVFGSLALSALLATGCGGPPAVPATKSPNVNGNSPIGPTDKARDEQTKMLPVQAQNVKYLGNNHYCYEMDIGGEKKTFLAAFSYSSHSHWVMSVTQVHGR